MINKHIHHPIIRIIIQRERMFDAERDFMRHTKSVKKTKMETNKTERVERQSEEEICVERDEIVLI